MTCHVHPEPALKPAPLPLLHHRPHHAPRGWNTSISASSTEKQGAPRGHRWQTDSVSLKGLLHAHLGESLCRDKGCVYSGSMQRHMEANLLFSKTFRAAFREEHHVLSVLIKKKKKKLGQRRVKGCPLLPLFFQSPVRHELEREIWVALQYRGNKREQQPSNEQYILYLLSWRDLQKTAQSCVTQRIGRCVSVTKRWWGEERYSDWLWVLTCFVFNFSSESM